MATIDELTTGNVEGTGTFDVMMRAVNAQIKEQYDSSRITGSDYATVYLGAMTAVLQQASSFLLQSEQSSKQVELLEAQVRKTEKEIALLQQKIVTEEAETIGDENTVGGLKGKQMELIQKQAEGFDRNAEQKVAKMMIDTWTVRQTTDGADTANNGLVDSEINRVLNIAKTGIGLTPYEPES